MYEQKMKETEASVIEFIEKLESPKKKEDAYRLLEIFKEVSGYEPKMWGPSIIGFGSYHYTYESGHSGVAPLVGFSPSKARFSLYLLPVEEDKKDLVNKLGKVKLGKSCIYVNKLADIDLEVLKEMIRFSIAYTHKLYPPKESGGK